MNEAAAKGAAIRADNQAIVLYAMERARAIEAAGQGKVTGIRISGGAARDLYLNVPIRDIDYLIRFADGVKADDKTTIIMQGFAGDDSEIDLIDESSYGQDADVFVKVSSSTGYTFEFIEVQTPGDLIDATRDYPDDLSRIQVDTATGAFITTPDFIDAAGTETISIRGGYSERADKLARKFPDFRVFVLGKDGVRRDYRQLNLPLSFNDRLDLDTL